MSIDFCVNQMSDEKIRFFLSLTPYENIHPI